MFDEIEKSEARQLVRLLIALGRDDFDAIVEQGTDYLGRSPEAASLVRELTIEEFSRYMADEATWPEVLDSDRLLRAFMDLDGAGIIARTDFTCCRRCGVSEIGGEVPRDERHAYRGYVFCHRQDMENAVHRGSLHLAYGVFDDAAGTAGQAGIGEEVVEALRRRGLEASWNGDPRTRIEVSMTWRRRRFGRLATWPGSPPPSASDARDLAVTYCDYRLRRYEDAPVPVSLPQARGLLLELTPRADNFAVFIGRSGGVVQVCWEDGRRLWLEHPDKEARRSRGRHVTIDEADDMLTILAREDRVAVDRLGDLETRPWGA